MRRTHRHRVAMPFRGPSEARNVTVRLPAGYEEQSERRYPVLYMADGQNLFSDRSAYQGVSWAAGRAQDRREKQANGTAMIVVGIECHPTDRLREYSAWPSRDGRILREKDAWGARYAEWLIHTLVPYVEARYRTIPCANGRAIAGSSAGANISWYIARRYPDRFGACGLFSTALWLFEKDRVLNDTDCLHAMRVGNERPFYYLYTGTEEGGEDRRLSQMYLDTATELVLDLVRNEIDPKRIRLVVRHGQPHHESAWRAEFPRFLKALEEAGWGRATDK